MAMHTELWFPSAIWSCVLHNLDNNIIKEFAYDLKKQDRGRTLSNHGGYQSSDLKLGQCNELDKLVSTLNAEVESICKQIAIYPLEIKNIWININPQYCYNNLHNHVGSVLSGVYYVEAKEGNGNISFERTDGAENFLPAQNIQTNYFNSYGSNYKSTTGALYIFPGWLKHKVDSNKIKDDRISISFNYGVKNEN